MAETTSQMNDQELKAEIVRLNKVLEALMNRAERIMTVQGSDFGLFETAVRLEEEVNRRTAQLEQALRENKEINRALKLTQKQMEAEIIERKSIEQALKKANQRLELLSSTDPLTGLANRRRFMAALETEWNRALRSGNTIGLAMIDIDHFKHYNDSFGHPAGDLCLQKVADALNKAVRRTDITARYGGEEFAVILPDAGHDIVYRVAERARKAVSDLQILHLENNDWITISIGVSAITPSNDNTIEGFIERADTALYAAKYEGRNRVNG